MCIWFGPKMTQPRIIFAGDAIDWTTRTTDGFCSGTIKGSAHVRYRDAFSVSNVCDFRSNSKMDVGSMDVMRWPIAGPSRRRDQREAHPDPSAIAATRRAKELLGDDGACARRTIRYFATPLAP